MQYKTACCPQLFLAPRPILLLYRLSPSPCALNTLTSCPPPRRTNFVIEPTAYKDFKVSRGFTYRYYLAAPRDTDKPFILLCHGFPSTSYDWHRQVVFFSEEGYGLIVPDMLGYGGSDKPTTTESYKMNAMAQDLIDILEHESARDVIAVGHDWGSVVVSRLAYLYQERFLAFGFLAVTYMPPDPTFSYKKVSEELEKTFGYNLFGYWEFFSSNGAPKIIEEHFDSFYSIAFPHDPTLWKDRLAPTGQVNKWLTSNRIEKRLAYITEEVRC
ncbi:alpha/beta-hydrolase [Fomitiporia mediterranea MF3/22]|uniref:alpha/beta-hydrolase n=1 Tax=Fomitiporia mediterranea (strain MF3/22) TaxID=694068 RepID=UPI0004407447|nr:alpha/beta-hydrolase [Fomitiporia mediterranea MF3/22]EJD08118.1 alpha/beta-hydrolase [Fomitiporia mediterranea MF3/22]